MNVNTKANVQHRPARQVSQRDKVGEAMLMVSLAMDCVTDCMACGSDVLPDWLSPAQIRLAKARALLSETLREGGSL
jgi:hypothetical protein